MCNAMTSSNGREVRRDEPKAGGCQQEGEGERRGREREMMQVDYSVSQCQCLV